MKFPFLILFAIAGTHCSKSRLSENPLPGELSSQANVSTEVTGKLQLLTREVSFTSTNPNLKRVREFNYDEQNRVTKIVLGTINTSGSVPPVLNVSRILTLFYENDSIMLPYKAASVRTVFPNLVTEFYYKYDDKGAKIQDSVRVLNQAGQPADRIVRYEYEKGVIIATPELTNFPIFFNPFDSLVTDKGNIVTKVSRTPTPGGDQINTFTFEFDNKINPYAAMNISNSLYFSNPASGIAYNVPTETHYIGLNRNNISSFTLQGFKTVIAYEYDKFKYPVKSESFAEVNPAGFRTTTYFTYKDKN